VRTYHKLELLKEQMQGPWNAVWKYKTPEIPSLALLNMQVTSTPQDFEAGCLNMLTGHRTS